VKGEVVSFVGYGKELKSEERSEVQPQMMVDII
jgi:hypothetical protein